MSISVLSASVTGTSVYKSRVTRNSPEWQRRLSYLYTFSGTMTGTAVLEGTNSSDGLIEADLAGGTDTTDKATWVPVFYTMSSSNTAVNTKSVSAAGSDSMLPTDNQTYKAYRFKYTNATDSGTVSVLVYSTRA
jgi:hypothetical protein